MSVPTSYTAWKAEAATDLYRLHGIESNRIPQRLWKQQYIRGATPREAADSARVYFVNALPSIVRRARLQLGR